jgi:hypothetical protein
MLVKWIKHRKTNHTWSHSYVGSKEGNFIEVDSGKAVTPAGQGEGRWEWCQGEIPQGLDGRSNSVVLS